MINEFYSLPAVLHKIPKSNIQATLAELASDSPHAKAFLLEHGGKTAGYCLLAQTYSNEAGGKALWVEEIYVRAEFQGKGLGGEMLDFIISHAKGKYKRIRLEISENNAGARRLYRQKGFKPLEYSQMTLDF